MTEFSNFKHAAQAQLAAMPRSFRSLTPVQLAAVETVLRTEGIARDLPVTTVRTLAPLANRPIRLYDGSTVTIRAHHHGGWYSA